MEVKNFEVFSLFNAQPGEKSFYRKLIGVKWPGGLSYELVKMGKALNGQLSVIDEARVNIIESMKTEGHDPDTLNHLEPDATEETKTKVQADFNDFAKAFDEILNKSEDIKVDKVKIPSAKIPDIEPEVLLAFDKFLEIT